MLTEERYATILRILEEKKAVTVLDLTKALDASESTVRRDLSALHKSGKLYKVMAERPRSTTTTVRVKKTSRQNAISIRPKNPRLPARQLSSSDAVILSISMQVRQPSR